MREQECPKCDNVVSVKWHRGYEAKKIHNRPVPTCNDMDVNSCKEEHLHYYCKCGYDFIKDISERKEDVVIEL